ncbi:hypothetical protein LENED_012239 [Lentinula edodes]|uniref:Uncharacterized protein n=1 Tax=Lentinula edodes TaxID=5353 RepID=A0A1Q3ES37_LENED|nr:hypothetical protein LENED_012239 [Lentinula edodes]
MYIWAWMKFQQANLELKRSTLCPGPFIFAFLSTRIIHRKSTLYNHSTTRSPLPLQLDVVAPRQLILGQHLGQLNLELKKAVRQR